MNGARAKQVRAYELRASGMTWYDVGRKHGGFGGADVHANGAMACGAAGRHAVREGLPWPIEVGG